MRGDASNPPLLIIHDLKRAGSKPMSGNRTSAGYASDVPWRSGSMPSKRVRWGAANPSGSSGAHQSDNVVRNLRLATRAFFYSA